MYSIFVNIGGVKFNALFLFKNLQNYIIKYFKHRIINDTIIFLRKIKTVIISLISCRPTDSTKYSYKTNIQKF